MAEFVVQQYARTKSQQEFKAGARSLCMIVNHLLLFIVYPVYAYLVALLTSYGYDSFLSFLWAAVTWQKNFPLGLLKFFQCWIFVAAVLC